MIDLHKLDVPKEQERKALPFEVSSLIDSILCVADSYSSLCERPNQEEAAFDTIATLVKTLRLVLVQTKLEILE